MEHLTDIDGRDQNRLLDLFETISSGNTILFLGAGASVGDKKYLSSEIIEYYESHIGKSYDTVDITEFVDVLSADPEFNRIEFDSFVERMLRKLKISDAHKTIATIPWREIITTNYDLLIEQAYDSVRDSSDFTYELYPVRALREYRYTPDNSQIKYIKLNGCISDKKRYPLLFSTDDFNGAKKFYKTVLQDLRNLSDKITILTIGYSFSDDFANQLFKRFDSFNFRERRWIYSIDPYVNTHRYPYYTQNRICIIQSTIKDFFERYDSWYEENCTAIVDRKRISFSTGSNNQIQIPQKLAVKLDGSLVQLNSRYRREHISPQDFYKGAEPNYEIISKYVDVIRKDTLNIAQKEIFDYLEKEGSNVLPIFCLTGSFGTGKSTFAYRLVYEFNNNPDVDIIAFEILDFDKFKTPSVIELFRAAKTRNILLYCDYVEVDSVFKSILEIRNQLSIEQFNDFQVFFLIPIRENILAKYKHQRHIKRIKEINIDTKLNEAEIVDLVEKLKEATLISYRDIKERNIIVNRIKTDFDGDSFITLLNLISGGSHINDLRDAFSQLSRPAQKAFVYTALLHRFKILMPVGLLKGLTTPDWSGDWNDFQTRIIRAEGKGILIQEEVESKGTDPDLYFKTKHPLVSEALINEILRSPDEKYEHYKTIFQKIQLGAKNSYLAINLLKAIFRNGEFSKTKLNKLYDICHNALSDDPYYLLHYAINLQYRGTEKDLKKGLDLLIYAESFFEYRNHRFTHRRAVLNFELAKTYYKNEGMELNLTLKYLNEAQELFEIKQIVDPCSSYSYVDYLKLLFWCLENIQYEEEEKIKLFVKIEESFDLAEKAVVDDINRILELKSQYANQIRGIRTEDDYFKYLTEQYQDSRIRPFSCILLYNYYETHDSPIEKLKSLIEEMEQYTDNNEVVKFLFKHYGRNLHVPNNRIKFFSLTKSHPILEKYSPLRYYYFSYMAECYDHHFHYAHSLLNQIKGQFNYLNPEFHYLWLESDKNVPRIFDGIIIRKHKQMKRVKVSELQQHFALIKKDKENYDIHSQVQVVLHFYLYGIRAEIIKNNEPTV